MKSFIYFVCVCVCVITKPADAVFCMYRINCTHVSRYEFFIIKRKEVSFSFMDGLVIEFC